MCAATEINFGKLLLSLNEFMVFLEKRTIFFECFMDIPDFKTCKVIKIEFNKQIIDRYDSKLDFRGVQPPADGGGLCGLLFIKIRVY